MLTVISAARPRAGASSDAGALEVLEGVNSWLADAQSEAAQRGDAPALVRHTRDRALLLMLFWRRISATELVGVRVDDLKISTHLGISCEVSGQGGARRVDWRPIGRPELQHLCPVSAVRQWLDIAGIDNGPLFPCIELDGALTRTPLPADGVLRLLLGLVERSDGDAGKEPANSTIDPAEARLAYGRRGRPRHLGEGGVDYSG